MLARGTSACVGVVLVSAALAACTSEPLPPFCAPAADAVERRVRSASLIDVGGRAVIVTRSGALLTVDDTLATTQVGLAPRGGVLDAVVGDELFFVGEGTLNASSDLGRTWSERVYAGTCVSGGDRLYALEDGVLRMSRDGARTWTERGVGFEGFGLTAIGERVWLSRGDGALESRDAGATFTPMANGATRVDQPALRWLLAWRDAAPFAYSVDEGASWRPYGGPPSVAGSLDALYGERGGRLATSVDRGETWAELGSAVGVTALSGAGEIVVYETAGDLFVRRGEIVRTLRMRRALDEAPFAPVLGGDGAIYVTIQRQALDPSSSLLEYELARSVDGEVWERRATLPEVVGAVVDVETAYWVRGDEVVITDDGGVSSRVLAPPPLGEPGYALPFAAVDRTAYAIGRALAEPRTWLLASTDGAEWVSLGPTPAWSVARGRDRSGRLYAITVETAARQALRWSEATGWGSWSLDTGCEVVVIGDEAARHCEGGTRHCLTLLEGGETVCVGHGPLDAAWGRLRGEIVAVDHAATDGSAAVWGADGALRGSVPVDYVAGVLTVPDGLVYAGSVRRCDGTYEARYGRIE